VKVFSSSKRGDRGEKREPVNGGALQAGVEARHAYEGRAGDGREATDAEFSRATEACSVAATSSDMDAVTLWEKRAAEIFAKNHDGTCGKRLLKS